MILHLNKVITEREIQVQLMKVRRKKFPGHFIFLTCMPPLITALSHLIHPISSDLGSLAVLSAVSTWVGDRLKIPRVVTTLFCFLY